MLGLGWTELLLTAAVAVLVFGPQDIPKIMYNAGRLARRLQYVRFAMSQQFEDFLKEHDLDELRRGVNLEAPETDEAGADEDIEAIKRAENETLP